MVKRTLIHGLLLILNTLEDYASCVSCYAEDEFKINLATHQCPFHSLTVSLIFPNDSKFTVSSVLDDLFCHASVAYIRQNLLHESRSLFTKSFTILKFINISLTRTVFVNCC